MRLARGPRRQLSLCAFAEEQDEIIGAAGREALLDAVTGEFAGECLQREIGRLRLQIVRHRSKVVLALREISAVVLPVVPNRDGHAGVEVGKLLASDEGSLRLQRNAFVGER